MSAPSTFSDKRERCWILDARCWIEKELFASRIQYPASSICRLSRYRMMSMGDARIGLALSDELGMLAHPLETVVVKEQRDPAEYIAKIVEREKVEVVVIGMPRNMNGTYGPAAEKTKAFAELLKAKSPCTIKFWDERLTTVAAQKSLHESGRNVKQGRSVIDQVAAQMILQGYLDMQAMS